MADLRALNTLRRIENNNDGHNKNFIYYVTEDGTDYETKGMEVMGLRAGKGGGGEGRSMAVIVCNGNKGKENVAPPPSPAASVIIFNPPPRRGMEEGS